MEVNKKKANQTEGDKEYIYVFEDQEMTVPKFGRNEIRLKIVQIIASICASLICIPFGAMLGWPSPTYPSLIYAKLPTISISADQSAMIAGSLMLGISVGSVFSGKRRFSPKFGLIFGAAWTAVAWALMWLAKDINFLLISRFLCGTAYGFSAGQLRIYIGEMADLANLPKIASLFTNLGVILAYSLAPFVSFRLFGLVLLILSIFVLFVTIFLPKTPRDLVKSGKLDRAKRLLVSLDPNCNIAVKLSEIREDIDNCGKLASFGVLKDAKLRKKYLVLVILVFCQQFTGLPATIVYCQLIFIKTHFVRPELGAILYSIIFFLATYFGAFQSPRYDKKNVLLISSVGVSIFLIAIIIVIFYKIYDKYNCIFLFLMIGFVIFYTVGLGNIPVCLINEYFPNNNWIGNFFTIFQSVLAIIITKTFQTLFLNSFQIYIPFCLFLSVSVFCSIFVAIFMRNGNKVQIYTIDR